MSRAVIRERAHSSALRLVAMQIDHRK